MLVIGVLTHPVNLPQGIMLATTRATMTQSMAEMVRDSRTLCGSAPPGPTALLVEEDMVLKLTKSKNMTEVVGMTLHGRAELGRKAQTLHGENGR